MGQEASTCFTKCTSVAVPGRMQRLRISVDLLFLPIQIWAAKLTFVEGTKYFQRDINTSYDLYINNCQTFVNHIADQICSNKPPEDRLISIPLFHVLSMSAGRLYTALGVPFLRLWFRLSGCDSVTLTEFERVSAFWGYWLLPWTLHSCATSFPIVIAEINKSLEEDPEKKLPESMRYVVAVMTSFWLFGFPIMQPLIILLASFPRAKRYPDGKWRLRYRPRRVPLMEVNGVMKIEDLRQEETVPPDGQDIIDEDGRFPDPDKLLIPTWLWLVSYILGFFLAVLYWSYRLTRYSLSSLKHKLAFNSKWQCSVI